MRLFNKDRDYEAFEEIVAKTLLSCPMRICAYCLMPNHWHFALWPERDGDLAAFMQKMTITHVRNWQEYRRRVGMGHVYQGRYKSFPIETDEYFYQVVRYVERNALRANLVESADQWRWSSLWRCEHGATEDRRQRKLGQQDGEEIRAGIDDKTPRATQQSQPKKPILDLSRLFRRLFPPRLFPRLVLLDAAYGEGRYRDAVEIINALAAQLNAQQK